MKWQSSECFSNHCKMQLLYFGGHVASIPRIYFICCTWRGEGSARQKHVCCTDTCNPQEACVLLSVSTTVELCLILRFPRTVQRELKKLGLNSCVALWKPLSSEANKKKGLRFYRDHKEWTLEQWKKVYGLMGPDLKCSRVMGASG